MTGFCGGVPTSAYSNDDGVAPPSAAVKQLRKRGLCLVERVASYTLARPNVGYRREEYTDERGRHMVWETYVTPYGELTCVWESAGFTAWRHEWLFKSPDDYAAVRFMINDTIAAPNYEKVAGLQEALGSDFVVRDQLPLEPMQNLISSSYMSTETFCIEWMENRDEVLVLCEALADVARRVYPIVANGPLEFCNYGGNVVPAVIGPQVFLEHYVPHYNEAAEVLHKKDKLIGTHLDADNTTIMDLVAQTQLDYIEAYDPGISPSVADAREAWPDKTLWINYPCAWHLRPEREVYERTLRLIEEAEPGNGFLIGITEDVPEDRWIGNCQAILDAIDYTHSVTVK